MNSHSSRERALCRICGAWRDKRDMQMLRLKPHWNNKRLVRWLCGACISLIIQQATDE